MTHANRTRRADSIMLIVARGTSVAESLDRAVRQPRQSLQETQSLGQQTLLDELAAVYRDCRTPGWDGFDARPVLPDTVRLAYCLIDSFPYGFPQPAIGAEPDGQLTFEWRKSPHRVLSVSIDPSGFLHYAGLFGIEKRYGTLAFYNSLPELLARLIQEL